MEQTGKELAGELSSYMGDNDEIKVCIFSAKEASPDLEAGLKEICELEKIDAYVNEQAYESIPESIGSMVSEAVFTSASNVERFFHMLPENAYVKTAYSIAVLEHHNVREIVQADDSSYEALVDKISYKDAFKD
jgi:uroporphyrinogen III methyltransferase/synthase